MLLVEMDEDLGVRVRRETVAAALQLTAQLAVVVDLAVLDDGDAAVLVGDRLVAVLEVDDRESPHRQRNPALVEETIAVRSAMVEPRVHRPDRLDVGNRTPLSRGHSADAAHGGSLIRAGAARSIWTSQHRHVSRGRRGRGPGP